MTLPILYSFRRCPYAMRARMGLAYTGIVCEIREILLSEKPNHLLEISPKGTVPVLICPNGQVIEQSLEILTWALAQNDPDGWDMLSFSERELMDHLINENDGPFKKALDRYKYPSRFSEEAEGNLERFSTHNREKVEAHLQTLEKLLKEREYLVKKTFSKADAAIFPFIRQMAEVEKEWFETLPYPSLQLWLERRLQDPLFDKVMQKYNVWGEGDLQIFACK